MIDFDYGFDQAFDELLKVEQGYSEHKNDAGGPTNFGITLKTLKEWRGDNKLTREDVKNLSIDEAKNIYKSNYWDKLGLDNVISPLTKKFLFDQAVNKGDRQAVKDAQRAYNKINPDSQIDVDGVMGPSTMGALNSVTDDKLMNPLIESARDSYVKIIENKPRNRDFRRGWANRLKEIENFGRSYMGSEDIPETSEELPKEFYDILRNANKEENQIYEIYRNRNTPSPTPLEQLQDAEGQNLPPEFYDIMRNAPSGASNEDAELAELAELEAIFGQGNVQSEPLPELGSSPQAPTKPAPGILDTASRMGVQGMTYGFGDEIGGLIQKGIAYGAEALGATNPYAVDQQLIEQGFTGDLQPSAFDAGVQDERQRITAMREGRPGLSFAAETIGGGLADAATGLGPIAGGALYGAGEAEGGLLNRGLGAAIGGGLGYAIPAAGARVAPYAQRTLQAGANKLSQTAVGQTAKQLGDRFNHAIAPGIKNIYTAISGNITQQDVPVLEAMSRQSDLFFNKPIKQNAKAAQATVNEEMLKLNKQLSQMTKQVASESGDNMLLEFQPFADSIRRNGDLLNSESLRRMADEFDEAILSGDYEQIFNTYKRLIKNRRQYSDDGKIARYKGANPDLVEEFDMLFTDANYKFLDDASRNYDLNMDFTTPNAGEYVNGARSYKDQLSNSLSRLRDLHIVDRHLDDANRYVRKSGFDSVALRDSLIGGLAGGVIGGAFGMPQLGIAGGAVGAATLRRSVAVNNIVGNIRNNLAQGMPLAMNSARGTISRTLNGAMEAAKLYGPDLIEAGVPSNVVAQLSKAATGQIVDFGQAEKASLELMAAVPEIFDEGTYASEIDGKITSPDDLGREQLRINQVLKGNTIERAKALSALNKDGTIYKGDSEQRNRLIKPMKSKTMGANPEQPNADRDKMVEEMRELQELEAIFGTR